MFSPIIDELSKQQAASNDRLEAVSRVAKLNRAERIARSEVDDTSRIDQRRAVVDLRRTKLGYRRPGDASPKR